jgi:hypothetical protein
MNYVQATSRLIQGTALRDLANEMRVSRGWLAHSRLASSNPQHRPPPEGWEAAVAKIARRRIEELRKLVNELERAPKKRAGARKSRAKTAGKRKAAKRGGARKKAARGRSKRGRR